MATAAAPEPDAYARRVLARMTDFFTDEGTPWPRRLWDIGAVLALEELWEAGHWQAHNVLSASACDWQRNELRALIGPDQGLGDQATAVEIAESAAAIAADRMSAIIACSWPRAELTTLAHRHTPASRTTSTERLPPPLRGPGPPRPGRPRRSRPPTRPWRDRLDHS